jgi:hypothetical protein
MEHIDRVALLRDEYLLLQKFYEDFDSQILQIKGWNTTVGLAAIGAGFYKTRFLWLFASGVAVIFWIVEALWKSFQYMYAPRIQQIESAFRSESFNDVAPLQIYTSWFERFNKVGFERFFKYADCYRLVSASHRRGRWFSALCTRNPSCFLDL